MAQEPKWKTDCLFFLIAKSVACIPLSLTYALLECVNSSLNHMNIINKMGMPATYHMHDDVAEVDSFLSRCCQAHSSLRVSLGPRGPNKIEFELPE